MEALVLLGIIGVGYLANEKNENKNPVDVSVSNEINYPSNNNTFFHAIKEAGIVTATKSWNGKFTDCVYTKGPNWDTYLDNKLRCNNR